MSGSPALLKAIQNLGNRYPHVRCQAVTALAAALGERGRREAGEEVRIAARCLADHVADADEPTAVKASACLASLGPAAAAVFPELARACLDRRPAVGLAAAAALVKLAKLNALTRWKGAEVLPVLAGGLMDLHPDVVSSVAAVMRSLEKDAEPAIEQLVEAYLLPEPHGALERLREKVTGHYHKRRQRCFELLGKIGPAAEPAVPALRQFVDGEDPWLRQQAISCIIRIRRA